MKKIAMSLVCFIMMLLSVVTVEAVGFDIHVEVKGNGEATYIDDGDTVTLTCEETEEPFIFWNIHGEYEIVDGYCEDKIFKIRPLSDITAYATYESAVPHKAVIQGKPPDMTSPQTGDTITPALIALFVIGLVYLGFAIWYAIAMNRLCQTNRRNKR